MINLNLTQQYYLAAVNEKGVLSSLNTYAQVCLVASALLELSLKDCISIDKNIVSIKRDLTNECLHLAPLYEHIKNVSPSRVEKIVESYTLTAKRLNQLIIAVEQSFTDRDMFEVVSVGIMKNKEKFVPSQITKMSIVEQIRAELLENKPTTDEVSLLAILLDKGGLLKLYFSRFEQKAIQQKIKDLSLSPEGKIIKQMIEYVDMSMVMFSVIATM